MSHYDVFNGDADGLCALQQLRLHTPVDNAILITGVKRDISLLQRVEAQAGDNVWRAAKVVLNPFKSAKSVVLHQHLTVIFATGDGIIFVIRLIF